jgi:hypothetical protein
MSVQKLTITFGPCLIALLLTLPTQAANLLNTSGTAAATGLQAVNASQIYGNLNTLLPFVSGVALTLAFLFVFFLPRFVAFPLTIGALSLLANFAPSIINLSTGRGGDSIAAGANLFSAHQIVIQSTTIHLMQ